MTPANPSVVRKKLALIVGNLQALEPIARLSVVQYREDLFRRKGTERLLQELIEASVDVNAHLLVQEGYPPPDDYYHGFLMLAEKRSAFTGSGRRSCAGRRTSEPVGA